MSRLKKKNENIVLIVLANESSTFFRCIYLAWCLVCHSKFEPLRGIIVIMSHSSVQWKLSKVPELFQ